MKDCLHCNKEIEDPKHQNVRKYCSNTCQQGYQSQKKVDKWLAEGNVTLGSYQMPHWIRRYIKDRDNHECTVCGLSVWMGRPITLEVDHIDGDWSNNNVDNLRSICPNCHSQTSTYKGANRGKGRPARHRGLAQSGSAHHLG